jgi:hypothetical protein
MLLECSTPSLTIDIEEVRRKLIVNTGSNVSILGSNIKVSPLIPFGVTRETLDVKGRQTVTFALGGKEFKHTFLVCQLPTDAAGLIGADFLGEAGAIVSFDSCELLIPHGRYDPAREKTSPRNARRSPCSRRVKRRVALDPATT